MIYRHLRIGYSKDGPRVDLTEKHDGDDPEFRIIPVMFPISDRCRPASSEIFRNF